jgi:hypothetical protein
VPCSDLYVLALAVSLLAGPVCWQAHRGTEADMFLVKLWKTDVLYLAVPP